MDPEYRLFNIGWGYSTSRRRESWERFKRRVARILCLSSLAKFDYCLYFYFYERIQNKCVHMLLCDKISINDYCSWLFFLKTEYSV